MKGCYYIICRLNSVTKRHHEMLKKVMFPGKYIQGKGALDDLP
jgi:hypothetical protein